jgi:hypothetical protein
MKSVTFNLDTRELKKLLNLSQTVGERVIDQGYQKFYSSTPIRTGNARSRTRLDKPNRTINGDYPYASKLDEGYSRQAPQGMSDPTIAFMEKIIDKEIRKL